MLLKLQLQKPTWYLDGHGLNVYGEGREMESLWRGNMTFLSPVLLPLVPFSRFVCLFRLLLETCCLGMGVLFVNSEDQD